eukprot:491434-Prymnesium_polylepis.2
MTVISLISALTVRATRNKHARQAGQEGQPGEASSAPGLGRRCGSLVSAHRAYVSSLLRVYCLDP